MKNTLIGALIIGAVLGTVAFFNLSPFRSAIQQITGSVVGTTFNTAKVAAINFSPATGTATSTSILNTDASDRIVTDTFATCGSVGTSYTAYTGAGLATLNFSAATSSTAGNLTNTNLVMTNTVATSTVDAYFASTTIAVGVYGRRWAAGSYMNFWSNATNTAACNIGLHYLGT